METIITFPANWLFGIAAFAARSDIRYYLETVKLEITETEKRLMATDGHRLVSMPMQHSEVEISKLTDIMIPVSAVEQLRKQKKIHQKPILSAKQRKGMVSVAFTGEGDQYQLIYEGAIVVFVPVSGTYPAVDRVIPSWDDIAKQERSEEYAFNWAYLADFDKFATLLTGDRLPLVVLVPGENDSAARVRFPAPYDDIVGVVMPKRIR